MLDLALQYYSQHACYPCAIPSKSVAQKSDSSYDILRVFNFSMSFLVISMSALGKRTTVTGALILNTVKLDDVSLNKYNLYRFERGEKTKQLDLY